MRGEIKELQFYSSNLLCIVRFVLNYQIITKQNTAYTKNSQGLLASQVPIEGKLSLMANCPCECDGKPKKLE